MKPEAPRSLPQWFEPEAALTDQLAAFDRAYTTDSPTAKNAVIIGGGRVGRAVGRAFAAEGIEFAIVEQLPERQREGGGADDRRARRETLRCDRCVDVPFLHRDGTARRLVEQLLEHFSTAGAEIE